MCPLLVNLALKIQEVISSDATFYQNLGLIADKSTSAGQAPPRHRDWSQAHGCVNYLDNGFCGHLWRPVVASHATNGSHTTGNIEIKGTAQLPSSASAEFERRSTRSSSLFHSFLLLIYFSLLLHLLSICFVSISFFSPHFLFSFYPVLVVSFFFSCKGLTDA